MKLLVPAMNCRSGIVLAPSNGGAMMKTVFALLAISFSSAAVSACYQIYSPTNQLVWQGSQPPFAMDQLALNDEVKKIVPNGHLIIVDDRTAPCYALDATDLKAAQYKNARDKRLK